MFAAPVSFYARDHKVRMSGLNVPSLTWSRMSEQRDPMRQPQFMRSTTFRWALAVAGVLAVFVIVLFGFIYWKTDDYLIARSDIMVAKQLDYLAGLSGERQRMAIDAHLEEDSRGVQYAGLFGPDGHKMAGNLEQLPPELKIDDSVQGVTVVRTLAAGPVAGALPVPAGRRLAEHACAEARGRGQSTGSSHHRRRSARAASIPQYRRAVFEAGRHCQRYAR